MSASERGVRGFESRYHLKKGPKVLVFLDTLSSGEGRANGDPCYEVGENKPTDSKPYISLVILHYPLSYLVT